MPIKPIAVQQRMMELGRVRLGGERQPKSPGKKLEHFRFTSASKDLLESVAERYGGTVQEWAGAEDEGYWQLYTEAAELDIVFPPIYGDADGQPTVPFSQWLELWSGGGCVRRCDGVTEMISEQPCLCDPDSRECKPTSRFSFLMPDIKGLGVWRVESKGWNAAAELPGTVNVLIRAATAGQFIPATLRLEHRTSNKGGETRKFVVPVIEIAGLSLNELTSGEVPLAINPPQPTPVKPALSAGAPDPPQDEKFANDSPPWPDSDVGVDTTDFAPPEHIALTEKLKALAAELDLAEATEKAIKSNRARNTSDLPKHIDWLHDKIAKAEESLAARGKQETLA